MCIEQYLMRSMKTSGGLTHGRGVTDSSLTKWTITMPYTVELCDALEMFCGVHSGQSEQHIELRDSQINRDNKDLKTILQWLENHNPFSDHFRQLSCISTGVVANESINCHMAREVGLLSVESMYGQKFSELHYKTKNKVKPIALITKSVKLGDTMILDSHQLFNRIICLKKTEQDLKHYFCYELAHSPPSLFINVLMRKGNKSSLIKLLKPKSCSYPTNEILYVVDGGWLLHRVIWPKLATFEQIADLYVSYILKHFGVNTRVVFDGYYDIPSTKDEEHRRRRKKKIPVEVVFTMSSVLTVGQGDFLSHEKNKYHLIQLLKITLEKRNIVTFEAIGDADHLIVSTAVNLAKNESNLSIVLVGEDTDLIVLSLVLGKNVPNLYFKKTGRGDEDIIFHVVDVCEDLGLPLINNLLFIHAISGCDTSSYIYKKGKSAALNVLKKHQSMHEKLLVFNNCGTNKELLLNIGHEFILLMYGLEGILDINEERFRLFNIIIAKQTLEKSFDLAVLPPTRDAVNLHILRVYHQIQVWLGNNLSAEEFGWKVRNNKMFPITMQRSSAPPELLNLIYCKCRNGCQKRCVCSQVGRWSAMCQNCHGIDCKYACVIEQDNLDV